MVHQHFQLIPVFTVAENVVLGNELRKGPVARPRRRPRPDRRAGASATGSRSTPTRSVGDLSVGEQQRVELIKALFRDADILILDEPTAVLTPGEVDDFFAVVRSLVDAGQVDHLHHPQAPRGARGRRPHRRAPRRARSSARPTPAEATAAEPGHADGRAATSCFAVDKAPEHARATSVLRVAGPARSPTTAASPPSTASTSRCGPARSSASPASRATASASWSRPSWACARSVGGTVEIDGHDVTHASPRQVIELGVGHVPEDRGKHGLVGAVQHRRQPRAQPLPRAARSPAAGCATTDAIRDQAAELVAAVRRPHPEPGRRRRRRCRAATSRR